MLPNPIVSRPLLNRRLRIKSSLSKPRSLISGVILLWIGTGRPSELVYADIGSDNQPKLQIDNNIFDNTATFWGTIGAVPPNFKELLESCPIFDNQIEPLQVALELIWKLCKVSFVNEGLATSSERTGGLRKVKKLQFTIVMDIINEILIDNGTGSYKPEVFEMLVNWLDEKSHSGMYEKKLMRVLLGFTEDTHFAIKEETGQLIEFQQEGVYQSLLMSDEVELGADEKMGPLRIFNSILDAGLHPYLELSSGTVVKRGSSAEFDTYQKRVSHFLDIVERPQSISIVTIPPDDQEADDSLISKAFNPQDTILPRNWIIYGAPGTGKSHYLNDKCQELQAKEIIRVTFYSDYTYGQFVGGYRPAPLYEPGATTLYLGRDSREELRPGKPIIEYRFVPGPLLNILERAVNDKSGGRYLLIIEELNRADAPAVFGDIFQLLDRNSDGESKYPVRLSSEATEYLVAKGLGKSIVIPSNLYIWATLNNADQGVVPLDTAFKRRWSFSYMGLNDNESQLDDKKIQTEFLSKTGDKLELDWNTLRKKINAKLSALNIHEDMHIGPFFLSGAELSDDSAFKYKLLSYIRDDILRHRADEFFTLAGSTLSALLEEYGEGKNIFRFDLD
jgi:5-methylcytosine-specific restriction enzyme B